MAAQIGDVMVMQKYRGILTRKSVFFQMTASFVSEYAGKSKLFYLLFGFPNERHLKLAEHLQLYSKVGYLSAFSWQPRNQYPGITTRLQPMNRDFIIQNQDAINAVWYRMDKDLSDGVVGVRDSRYLVERYLDHPEKQYHVVLIRQRWTGRFLAILVLEYSDEKCHIVDIVSSLKNIPLILFHARRLASLNQCSTLNCIISNGYAGLFQMYNAQQSDVQIPIANSPALGQQDLTKIKDKWWLMAGDMDFK